MKRWRLSAVLLSMSLAALSCTGGGAQPSASASAAVWKVLRSDGCPSGPCIEITAPEPGATLRGGSVVVETKVTNFKLVDKLEKKPKKGEGHIVFYRLESRDAVVPSDPKKSALHGGKGEFTSFPSVSTRYEWLETPGKFTPPGIYVFAVQLVDNDNTPLSEPQSARVAVSAQP